MQFADNSFGSFIIVLDIDGEDGYIAVHPQMYPAETGLKLGGDFFLYCVFPHYGSCHFSIKQDKDKNWIADDLPDFLYPESLNDLGKRIVDDVLNQIANKQPEVNMKKPRFLRVFIGKRIFNF